MDFERRRNPLTGEYTSTRLTPYCRGEWRVVECEETGMVFLENPPSYDRLAEEFAWQKTYETETKRRKQAEPFLSRISGMVKWVRLNLKKPRLIRTAATQIREVRALHPEGTQFNLVDVGCGGGEKTVQIPAFLLARGQAPVSPIGVEVSHALAAEAHQRFGQFGGKCIECPAIEGVNKIDENSVHLVILSSFLEHEINPVGLLSACFHKLVKGGRIIIKVPNFDSWNRKIRQERWCGFRYPDHVNYFTPDTLRSAVERAGLRVRPVGRLDMMSTSDNRWLIAEKA